MLDSIAKQTGEHSLLLKQWLGLALMAATFAVAQNAYAIKTLAGQTVFYNPQVVVFESNFIAASNKELKRRFGNRETKLNTEINKFRADVKKFQETSKTMAANQREKEAKELGERDVALQKQRNALEQDTLPLKRFVDLEMTKMLRAACAELHAETGCTAILDTTRNTVMFLAPEADVSQSLRKKVDALWKKQAPKFVFPK